MSDRDWGVPSDETDEPTEGVEEAKKAALGEDEGETKRLNVRVPAPLYDRFKDKADSEGRTMTWLVLQFIRDYVTE
ncbi:hypothetical protein GGQ00_003288 [Salinibacter ruber]|jgi:hypothetical protein|uniref:ribbon-helix-helix domain-containing protein n=1 Tax=Salinibacter ruber TaxID=146919 RepID=UPI00216918E8|nr:hypothetical protein [Salinibacter ruber]MCS4044825.1 hypothetical protein [Salinibacter ruber]